MKITKITAASREDILKQRNDYDSVTKEYSNRIDEGERKWKSDLKEQRIAMEKKLSDLIGPTSLELQIKADPWGYFSQDGWSVRINANEDKKFNDEVSLAWNWEAGINSVTKEVTKESGSWSGLKAVTPEQIGDLEESVRILKILNNIDWKEFLSSPMADYEDYISKEDNEVVRQRKKDRPDFESDLEAASLEEAIGTNTAFQLRQDQFYRGEVGILVTGLTDKFVKGYIFPIRWAEDGSKSKQEIIDYVGSPRRTSREYLVHTTDEDGNRELKSYQIRD